MLLSMTGFGDARRENERLCVRVEVRSVNNRYLKVSTKISESLARFEADVEKVVREYISRGTVSVAIRIRRLDGNDRYHLNGSALSQYWQELTDAAHALNANPPADIGCLLTLPDIVSESTDDREEGDDQWELVRGTLSAALQNLQEFRRVEGAAMAQDMQQNCQAIGERLHRIQEVAPHVARDYRDRILLRIRELLQETEAKVEPNDLIREVSIFADRCDINEEITRLKTHLDQFQGFLQQKDPAGRKLDFMSQEMNREINTIGSKANNVSITHAVVEMKAALERIREVLQNVE